MRRIFLSAPHLLGSEGELLSEVLASNWIAPLGPAVDAFERELAGLVEVGHAAALCSGTAALHLALRLVGLSPGDEVLCSSLSFAASAFPILYEQGNPVFIDSTDSSWNIDPHLLGEELQACAKTGRRPRAVVAVDLYGQCADYDEILRLCQHYDVPLIEDAAEALGASYRGRMAGSLGEFGVFSFNGNKIITTSGGGALVSNDELAIVEARRLASQARDPAPHYEHSTLGYNYRMSNLLAAVGRAQLRALEDRVRARRRNFELYSQALGDLPGIEFMPEAPYGRSTRWLTALLIHPEEFGATREHVRLALEAQNVESRPTWKPLHLQPVFTGCRARGGAVAERIFERGLCLPSGSSLTESDIERIVGIMRRVHERQGS